MINRSIAVFFTFLILMEVGTAFADVPRHCKQVERGYKNSLRLVVEDREKKESTKAAWKRLDTLTKPWLEPRIKNPAEARDEIFRGEPEVWSVDQFLVLQRMEVLSCDIIFSRDAPDFRAKREQLERIANQYYLQPPYRPDATTLAQQQAGSLGSPVSVDGLVYTEINASFNSSGPQRVADNGATLRQPSVFLPEAAQAENDFDVPVALLAAGPAQIKHPGSHDDAEEYTSTADKRFEGPETKLLAKAPYFVNNTNKYFVILASAGSRESGVMMMDKLKKSSPKHDFSLYSPYRNSPYYAIMIATWVSKDIAAEAQAEGLAVVKKLYKEKFKEKRDTPTIWCYPAGPSSCRSGGRQNSDPNRKKNLLKKSEAA